MYGFLIFVSSITIIILISICIIAVAEKKYFNYKKIISISAIIILCLLYLICFYLDPLAEKDYQRNIVKKMGILSEKKEDLIKRFEWIKKHQKTDYRKNAIKIHNFVKEITFALETGDFLKLEKIKNEGQIQPIFLICTNIPIKAVSLASYDSNDLSCLIYIYSGYLEDNDTRDNLTKLLRLYNGLL